VKEVCITSTESSRVRSVVVERQESDSRFLPLSILLDNMAPPKRRLTSSQTSSQASSSASAKPRPKKRARHEETEPHQPTIETSTLNAPEPALVPQVEAKEVEGGSTLPLPLPEPKKRTVHAGSLRRLSSGHPSTSLARPKSKRSPGADGLQTRDRQTLSGNRIGGKSKDLKDGVRFEEIWVSSKGMKQGRAKTGGGSGIGFSAWLKRGVGAFVDRG
jgi:hypothetical protein